MTTATQVSQQPSINLRDFGHTIEGIQSSISNAKRCVEANNDGLLFNSLHAIFEGRHRYIMSHRLHDNYIPLLDFMDEVVGRGIAEVGTLLARRYGNLTMKAQK